MAKAKSSPATLKNAHAFVHIFVEDVDNAFQKAVDAGAQAVMPPVDMFWGDRYSRIVDPFGQPWNFATRIEDLTPEEIKERQKTFEKEMAAACAGK